VVQFNLRINSSSEVIKYTNTFQVILHNSKTLKKPWTYKYFKGLGEGLVTAPGKLDILNNDNTNYNVS